MARIAVLALPQWKSLRQFFAINRVYGNLRKQTSSELTDEITLFAVASTARGLGVGKTLYGHCMEPLRGHDRSDFYLYTDSLCTYQFYESQGMTRAAEEAMTILLDGEPEGLDVYLYTGATQ